MWTERGGWVSNSMTKTNLAAVKTPINQGAKPRLANPVPPRGILRIRTTKVTIKLFKQRIRISIVAGVDPANPYGSIM